MNKFQRFALDLFSVCVRRSELKRGCFPYQFRNAVLQFGQMPFELLNAER